MDTIQENITISTRNLRKVRANAVNARKDFLQELKERIATRKTQTTISTEKAIKIIENQQRKGKAHRKIKNTLSRGMTQTLSRIQITKEKAYINPENGKTIYIDTTTNRQVEKPTIITIDSKRELEQAILERNKKHLSKAKATPWHRLPLKKKQRQQIQPRKRY